VQLDFEMAKHKELETGRTIVLPIIIEKDLKVPLMYSGSVFADFSDEADLDTPLEQLLASMGVEWRVKDEKDNPEDTSLDIDRMEPEKSDGFKDVKLKNLDRSMTKKIHENKDVYEFFIKLSRKPEKEWTGIFSAERLVPRHDFWRDARIVDDCIVISCPEDELKKHHIPDLKKDITNTNSKYKEYILEHPCPK